METKVNQRLFLDIHAIQTIPPANINRDDTGSPKTAQYGGVTRARVSSQSWKRAMRLEFPNMLKGTRTKRILELFSKEFKKRDINFDLSLQYDILFLIESLDFGIKEENDEILLKVLFMFSKEQVNKIIDYYIENRDEIHPLGNLYYEEIQEEKNNDKKNNNKLKRWRKFSKDELKKRNELKNIIEDILTKENSIDTYLFGRMLAGKKNFNVDASSQVAHAISTHAIESEFDFFTAVDDLAPEDNAGAGMLGTIEYNSSTLYRYANIALHDFYKQLGDKASVVNATKLFVEAFAKSMPTGKINTFANQTIPQAVIVSLRSDRPVNMVSAFEEPIKSSDGYVKKSIEKLFEEYPRYNRILNKPIFTGYFLFNDLKVNDIGKAENSLENLLNDLEEELNKEFED